MKNKSKKLHFSLLIFLVCLLLTFIAWDHYFNSNDPLDRVFVSNLILTMGFLFSGSAGTLVWSLESGKAEAQRRHRQVEAAYQKLQETQDELIQAEKLASIGRVAAGLVHELNSPLITIQGYLKLLDANMQDARQETRKSLEIISRQAERCSKTVRDLLMFSRKEKPRIQPAQLEKLLDTALENLALEFKTDRIQVIKKYPPACPEIQADPDQLQRVFSNLLVNAWHALKESKNVRRITLTLLPAAEFVQIFLTDTGSGIPKENLNKIFEPFFTTKPAGKGTGLGLSLSHSIIQMHGGKMAVESEEGKGTTFFVELPLQVYKEAPEKGAEADPKRKKQILVADDDPCIVQFITTLMNSWGYETLPAASGEEAVSVASKKNGEIDLIILDVHMPGIDGFETAKRIKTHKNLSSIPIIFLTGYQDTEEAARSAGLQGQAVLTKPFHYEDLHRYVLNELAP